MERVLSKYPKYYYKFLIQQYILFSSIIKTKRKTKTNTHKYIEKCEAGHFMSVDDDSCHACPIATYQSLQGTATCIPCGVGLTTSSKGTPSKSLCYRGEVDECSLGIDNCTNNTLCVDILEGFLCQCDTGQYLDGEANLSSSIINLK